MKRPLVLGIVVTAALVSLPACSDDDAASARDGTPASGCGPDEQERIDPASANHVFAGGAEPDYLTDPPTSGPHEPGPARSGVLDEPLTRPQQVGQLEAGAVLLQHGDLAVDELAKLVELEGDRVLVVPNPDLPTPIVATAWTRKMMCETVDSEALAAFADAHIGGGPGTDG